ncbi:hypothetical protein R7U64_03320 [Mesomycoplasma ovipneumoniae]|uniref:hypothetical protein n=1 Tax=Mesomycoplasma ovipneumoniae TaxID=29562 RepID=UPI0029653DC3|nr:hypothetical protein [Mesomycoplasma ovipneumoniae]MDW2917369.1 hypothetical protein [Mesomycoplasma ovipneumoniae]
MASKIFTKKWVIFSILGASIGSIGISVPLIYYFLNQNIEVGVNAFKPKTLINSTNSSTIFSNSYIEKINEFILENELKRGKQQISYALKNNFQDEYDFETANNIFAFAKMTGDKSQLEKINSILKIAPNLPSQIQFNQLYYITNIYLNIDPKKNLPKLISLISKYYNKEKKRFEVTNDREYLFRDLNFILLYFKLNGFDFQEFFDIKDWINEELINFNFENNEVLIKINDDHKKFREKQHILFRKYIPFLSIINILGKFNFTDTLVQKQQSLNTLIKSWKDYYEMAFESNDIKIKPDMDDEPGIVSFYFNTKNFYNYNDSEWEKIKMFSKNVIINSADEYAFYMVSIINYYFGNNQKLEQDLIEKNKEIIDYSIENILFPVTPDITKTIFLRQILDLSTGNNDQKQKINQAIEDLFNKTTKKPDNNPDFFEDLYNYVFFSIKTHPDFFKSQKDFLNTIIDYSKFVKKPIHFFYLFKTIALLNSFYNTDKPTKINVSKQIFDNIINVKLEKNAPFFLKFINLFIKFIFKNELDSNKEIVEFINQNLDEKNINNVEFLEHLFWYLEFQSAIKLKLENQIDSTKLEKFISLLKKDILDKIDKKIGKTRFLNIKTIYLTYQIDWLLKDDKN